MASGHSSHRAALRSVLALVCSQESSPTLFPHLRAAPVLSSVRVVGLSVLYCELVPRVATGALPETLRGVPWSAAASAHAAARYAHHDGHEGVDDGPKLSVGLVVGRQRAKPVPEEQDEHSNCSVKNRGHRGVAQAVCHKGWYRGNELRAEARPRAWALAGARGPSGAACRLPEGVGVQLQADGPCTPGGDGEHGSAGGRDGTCGRGRMRAPLHNFHRVP